MGGKHLTMCININPCTLCLLKQVFNIVQIMTRNKNTRTLAYPNVYFGKFGVSIAFGICFIEQSHYVNTIFAGF